jgi:hypothetical protein
MSVSVIQPPSVHPSRISIAVFLAEFLVFAVDINGAVSSEAGLLQVRAADTVILALSAITCAFRPLGYQIIQSLTTVTQAST